MSAAMAAGPDDHADALAELADDLLQQASELRRQWELLGQALASETPPPRAAEDDREADAARQGAEADPRLLIALDMVLSGRTRDEVGAYLRSTFGAEGTEEILVQVFDQD